MSFGKRQGWKEGAIVLNGRHKMLCRVTRQTTNSIVFEVDDQRVLPFHFSLFIDGTLLDCEVKMQRGREVYVTVSTSDAPIPVDDGASLQAITDDTEAWAGFRPSFGFRR